MSSTSFLQKKLLKDERLNIDHLDRYSLSFFLSSSNCVLVIIDEPKKRLMLLEHYTFDSKVPLKQHLDALHREHVLIAAGFWKQIKVVIQNQQFCVVPDALFDADFQYDYIKLNAETDPHTFVYKNTHLPSLKANFVFGIEKQVVDWFDKKYYNTSVRYEHQGICFLKNIVAQDLVKSNEDTLFIELTHNQALIAGYQKNTLAIYNQFSPASLDQLIKMLVLAAKQFSGDGQAIALKVWGVKTKTEAFKPLLKKYFKNHTIGKRITTLKKSYQFDELESYEYFSALSPAK